MAGKDFLIDVLKDNATFTVTSSVAIKHNLTTGQYIKINGMDYTFIIIDEYSGICSPTAYIPPTIKEKPKNKQPAYTNILKHYGKNKR